MMTKLQVRALLYGVIAGGQTLALGINEGVMTARDWIQLLVSSTVAAAIAVRALYDTSPDLTAPVATAPKEEGDRVPKPPAPTGAVVDPNAQTKELKP